MWEHAGVSWSNELVRVAKGCWGPVILATWECSCHTGFSSQQPLWHGLSCRETSSSKALPKALPGWSTSRDLSMWEFKGSTLASLMDTSSSKASSWGWQWHQAGVPAGCLLTPASTLPSLRGQPQRQTVLVLDQQSQSWLPVQPTCDSVKVISCWSLV